MYKIEVTPYYLGWDKGHDTIAWFYDRNKIEVQNSKIRNVFEPQPYNWSYSYEVPCPRMQLDNPGTWLGT